AAEDPTRYVVRLVPPARLLVETDSPCLSPPGAPRGRNEPEWVGVTAGWVAGLRGDEPDAAGDMLVATYDRVFGATHRVATGGAGFAAAGRAGSGAPGQAGSGAPAAAGFPSPWTRTGLPARFPVVCHPG